jgi:ribose/xylose/arabinose/galactoside ABC-type transport system permease subunit
MLRPNRTDTAGVKSADAAAVMQAKVVRRQVVENSLTLLVFLFLFVGLGVWLGSYFLDVNGRVLDIHQNAPTLLLALAVLITLVPDRFDLSVASVATLSCFLSVGLTVREGWPLLAALALTFGVGLTVGLVNGLLIEVLKVNSFIATLGTGAICLGASAVYSGGTLVGPQLDGPQLPEWYSSFANYSEKAPAWLVIALLLVVLGSAFVHADHLRPVAMGDRRWLIVKASGLAVIVLLLVFVVRIREWIQSVSWLVATLFIVGMIMWVLLEHTTFGRHIRAIGSNRSAALLAGVKVRTQVVKCFVLGGFLGALSGVLLGATQGTATPDNSVSFLLPAFAAAFLSTVILSDGRFTVPGALIGGIFVIWVGIALIIGGLPPTWLPVVNGTVLVGTVTISTALRRTR